MQINVKRGFGVALIAFISSASVSAAVSLVPLSFDIQNVIAGILLTGVYGLLTALYFENNFVVPSAKTGLYFGGLIILVGFCIGFIFGFVSAMTGNYIETPDLGGSMLAVTLFFSVLPLIACSATGVFLARKK